MVDRLKLKDDRLVRAGDGKDVQDVGRRLLDVQYITYLLGPGEEGSGAYWNLALNRSIDRKVKDAEKFGEPLGRANAYFAGEKREILDSPRVRNRPVVFFYIPDLS